MARINVTAAAALDYLTCRMQISTIGVFVLLTAGTLLGCSSSSLSTNPTPVKCQVSADTMNQSVAAAGGSARFGISAQPECSWTAAAQASWISDVTPASGQGSLPIDVTVTANPDPATREGVVNVNGMSLRITQAAAPCTFDVSPASRASSAGPDALTVSVTTATACSWTASSNDEWITLPSGGHTGTGTVRVTIAANAGPARVGSATVAGKTVTLLQAAGGTTATSCSYAVDRSTQSIGAAGGPMSVALTTTSECSWAAASAVPWITIGSAAVGAGNATVTFSVQANPGSARSGNLTVGGQTVTVNQDAAPTGPSGPACSYNVAPASQAVAAGGGAGAPISITTANGCTWTATSGASWLTISAGATGTGNGTVAFSAAANSGAARVGTLTVAGQAITINQPAAPAATCTYALSAMSQTLEQEGGSPTVNVTTSSGCAWTATSNASWISVSSGTPGNGNGTVLMRVERNLGAQRTGTVTVAGQTFTVTQAEATACAFTLTPTIQTAAASGGSGNTAAVTTTAGCAWTAVSNVPWATIDAGASGSGSGSVTYTIAPNPGGARTGTLRIAEHTLTVNQDGAAPAACSYSISPTTAFIGAAGGPPGTVTVSTGSGCAWTAVSHAPWITWNTNSSGSGGASVYITVAPNTGPARSGTVTIAGETYTVNQAAGP